MNASQPVQQLVSPSQIATMTLYLYSARVAVAFCGILTNLINMLVFYKMGFASPSNISLFGLAISDFYCLTHTLIVSFGLLPAFRNAVLPISFKDVTFMISSIWYSVSATGSWITAIINVERSCCVVFPIKVKTIFTRKTIIGLIAGMAIYQVVSTFPRYLTMGLVEVKSPATNRTMLTIDMVKYDQDVFSATLMASSTVPTLLCFVVVVIGTIFLITSFKRSRRLRESMTTSKNTASSGTADGNKPDKMADKDTKLIRSVIAICIVYIVGATPNVLVILVLTFYPRFQIFDAYLGNLAWGMALLGTLIQSVSFSVNIFVYFNMMSKYQQTFKTLFLGNKLEKC